MFKKSDSLFLKGIAILLLLYHHNPVLGNGDVYPVFEIGCRCCVWIFLFITAYGFSAQMSAGYSAHPFKFIIKRLALLYFPYWIYEVFFFFNTVLLNRALITDMWNENKYAFLLEIFNLEDLFGRKHLWSHWYINFVVVLIVVFPIIHFLVKKIGYLSIPLAYALIVVNPFDIYSLNGGYYSSYYLVIVIGIVFYEKKLFEKIKRLSGIKAVAVTSAGTAVLVALFFLNYRYTDLVESTKILRPDPISTLMAMTVVLLVYLARKDGKISNIMERLGKYSAGIFYVHSLYYVYIFTAFPVYHKWLSFFICLAVSTFISASVEQIKTATKYNERLRSKLALILHEDRKK